MKRGMVAAAAIIALAGLSAPAFGQAAPEPKPYMVSPKEAGPATDKAAIEAPNVEPGYKVPRLLDGHPNLMGVWSMASNTRTGRPGNMKNLVMTDEEAAHARDTNPGNIRQKNDDNQNENTKFDGKDLQGGRGYNAFWIDPGTNYGLVKGTWRTSWIVEPANGQIPFRRDGGPSRARGEARLGTGYDNPEERNLNERCIILTTSGPPLGQYLYNNNMQLIQSPDHVVIVAEMIHDARIIPIGGKHKPAVLAPYMGDSVGWWEGDTLVVETVNMQKGGSTVRLSPTGKITERFTRYNDKQIYYEFEVDDPVNYSQVWKAQMSLNSAPAQYEYACHEGNYGLHGILAGGRTNDRRGVKNGSANDRDE